MEEGIPIEHGMVTRSIERAQSQVEAQNFAMRKHLLEYDDVMNKQRQTVYDLRRRLLEGQDVRTMVDLLTGEIVDWYLESYCEDQKGPEEWNLEGLRNAMRDTFGLDMAPEEIRGMGLSEMRSAFPARLRARYLEKEQQVGPEVMAFYQRMIMLQIVDQQWKDHLFAIDHLKEGINLRSYGQRDPLVEYKKESYDLFQGLTNRIDEEMMRWIYQGQIQVRREEEAAPAPASATPPPVTPTAADRVAGSAAGTMAAAEAAASATDAPPRPRPAPSLPGLRHLPRNLTYNDPAQALAAGARAAEPEVAKGGGVAPTQKRDHPKVGRNDPCPCGSGKKYKKCHGA
jgi:preprotein translocase subunit SecA